MKLQITLSSFAFVIAMTFCAFALMLLPVYASEDGHDHDHSHSDTDEDHAEHESHTETVETEAATTADVERMQLLISLLTQLLDAMQKQSDMDHAMHMDDHGDEHENAELAITVEQHLDETHVHVYEDGEETSSFFLTVSIEDEDAVYNAIVEETGLDRDDVVMAVAFETDDHDHDDHDHDHDDHAMDSGETVDESYADMEGIEGIHIMNDGSVMLGNGVTVLDAEVTEDGMILLGDGTEVEPVMDMR